MYSILRPQSQDVFFENPSKLSPMWQNGCYQIFLSRYLNVHRSLSSSSSCSPFFYSFVFNNPGTPCVLHWKTSRTLTNSVFVFMLFPYPPTHFSPSPHILIKSSTGCFPKGYNMLCHIMKQYIHGIGIKMQSLGKNLHQWKWFSKKCIKSHSKY